MSGFLNFFWLEFWFNYLLSVYDWGLNKCESVRFILIDVLWNVFLFFGEITFFVSFILWIFLCLELKEGSHSSHVFLSGVELHELGRNPS